MLPLSPFMTYYARNLPHWHPPGQDIFITWRLYGSLPANRKLPPRSDPPGKRFLGFDRVLDAASAGPLWLKDHAVAQSVISTLQKSHDQKLFYLHSFVVMANHVHVLLQPVIPVARITHTIKGGTARQANRILRRTGARFWQDESFDHWVRTPQQFHRIRTYIESNPVSAGLVQHPQDWPWSSASRPK